MQFTNVPSVHELALQFRGEESGEVKSVHM